MNLQELKGKEPEELLKQADKLGIENPSSLRKQDLMFSILKTNKPGLIIINGYFNILARITAHSKPKPNNAPALVLCTK